MFEGEKYPDDRTVMDLQNFVLQRLDVEIQTLSADDWFSNDYRKKEWLLFLCAQYDGMHSERDTILKLSAMLVRIYIY